MIRFTQEMCDQRQSMPKLNGAIVDPRYVPEHMKRDYLAKWGEWLRSNSYREPWMHDLIAAMRHRAKPGMR